jgi:hypothetical protein
MIYIILTEIKMNVHCYGVTATQLTKFIPSYCCNNNITLKTAAVATPTC